MAEPLLILTSFLAGSVLGLVLGGVAIKKYFEHQARKKMDEMMNGLPDMDGMDLQGGLKQNGNDDN